MDRLEAMRIFVRVAEIGSFAAVANQMNVARSVITRQVAALEAHLGAKLIARSTRRLSLTSAGVRYLEKSREILGLVEAAESDLSEENEAPRGQMRVTLPLSFGVRQLMPLFGEFLHSYPQIELELDFNDRRMNLIEGGFDLAIRIADRLEPGDVARKIGSSRDVTLASPGYLARRGKPRHPAELSGHECLGYLLVHRGGWVYRVDGDWRWFDAPGRLQANNGDALVAAAINGLGIVRAPTFIAEQAVRAGLVELLLPEYDTPELGIYAVFPSNRFIPNRVRALVDFLATRIGPRPRWDEILDRR